MLIAEKWNWNTTVLLCVWKMMNVIFLLTLPTWFEGAVIIYYGNQGVGVSSGGGGAAKFESCTLGRGGAKSECKVLSRDSIWYRIWCYLSISSIFMADIGVRPGVFSAPESENPLPAFAVNRRSNDHSLTGEPIDPCSILCLSLSSRHVDLLSSDQQAQST